MVQIVLVDLVQRQLIRQPSQTLEKLIHLIEEFDVILLWINKQVEISTKYKLPSCCKQCIS